MTTNDAEHTQAGETTPVGTEPNAFARELLAHDPTLPEVPELPGEVRDQEQRAARHAAEGPDDGDEGERFDAG